MEAVLHHLHVGLVTTPVLLGDKVIKTSRRLIGLGAQPSFFPRLIHFRKLVNIFLRGHAEG